MRYALTLVLRGLGEKVGKRNYIPFPLSGSYASYAPTLRNREVGRL